MMRCPQECNVLERRQKGIKKRKREVGEEKSMKTQKATIKEEIDADMPNVVELITIKKNDQCKSETPWATYGRGYQKCRHSPIAMHVV